MAFEKVTRKQAKLRMALTGVSGSGKTLGALYVGYGITGDWGKVALIDTEHERARFYAGRSDLPTPTGEFLYASMGAPYSPEKYKQLVAEAAQLVGTDGVVIIDSLTHAWNNEGGVLDIKNEIAKQAGKNSYTAWEEAGKAQNGLINAILAVPCHTIVTLRSKMEYALETNERGKQQPVKLGLAPVQRDDTEYEFDIVLDIARNHIATASKDTTFLDQYGAVITPELGNRLAQWLSNGVEPETCAICGCVISPTKKRTVAQLIEGSTKLTGRSMCEPCVKRWLEVDKQRANELKEMEQASGVSYKDIIASLPLLMETGQIGALRLADLSEGEYTLIQEMFSASATAD